MSRLAIGHDEVCELLRQPERRLLLISFEGSLEPVREPITNTHTQEASAQTATAKTNPKSRSYSSMLKRQVHTHPENVVPKSTPTISLSLMGGCSRAGSLTGPLMASVELGGV